MRVQTCCIVGVRGILGRMHHLKEKTCETYKWGRVTFVSARVERKGTLWVLREGVTDVTVCHGGRVVDPRETPQT